LRSYPLLEGGGATPIKQMSRYPSLGVAGEVRQPVSYRIPNGFKYNLQVLMDVSILESEKLNS
jgi:hypothetical protein